MTVWGGITSSWTVGGSLGMSRNTGDDTGVHEDCRRNRALNSGETKTSFFLPNILIASKRAFLVLLLLPNQCPQTSWYLSKSVSKSWNRHDALHSTRLRLLNFKGALLSNFNRREFVIVVVQQIEDILSTVSRNLRAWFNILFVGVELH